MFKKPQNSGTVMSNKTSDFFTKIQADKYRS